MGRNKNMENDSTKNEKTWKRGSKYYPLVTAQEQYLPIWDLTE